MLCCLQTTGQNAEDKPSLHALPRKCAVHVSAGVSILVDQLEDEVRVRLGRVTSLVRASELGEPDA